MKKIIVLAGSREQFERYLDSNGLTDLEAVYGWCPEVMAGIEAYRIEIIGTFWDKPNAGKLKEFAEIRTKL